ncbi:MAG: MerR family transcriptional regulator [Proteobacteria bacterium]|nr:MerR family transcriptional regulator [Pseudomonadota bacterium]
MAAELPDKLYFKIGEVSRISGVKSFVLRYWETEFPGLAPERRGSKQRLYRKEDVELILLIKKMLYQDRFTIAGAKRVLSGRLAEKAPASAEEDEREETLKAGLRKKDTEIKTYQNLLKQVNKELQELKKILQTRTK